MLIPESDPWLLALFDSLAIVGSSGLPKPPRSPPDKHIVGGSSQVRVVWDGGQKEELEEDGQEEDLKVSQNWPVSK
jgi:hypothetical protein